MVKKNEEEAKLQQVREIVDGTTELHLEPQEQNQESADDQMERALEEADLESKPRKSRRKIDLVVDEVLEGKWGTGQARRLRLSQAGIDHREVQAEIVRRRNPR